MRIRTLALVSTLVAAGMLAACSGGSGGGSGSPTVTPPTSPPGGGGNPDPNGYIASSISMVNSIGAPLQENINSNDTTASGSSTSSKPFTKNGVCTKLFGNTSALFQAPAPSMSSNANSDELTRFSGATCAPNQVINDEVRSWTTPQNGGETVTFTSSKWETPNTLGSTPSAVRTGQIIYTNAAGYNQFGDPVFQTNTTRTETSQLSVNGTTVTSGSNEWIDAGPVVGQSNVQTYCGDTVGYNVTGDTTLDETFGWSSQTNSSNGTRTTNPNGSVVFSATRVGQTSVGAINSMSIASGAPNSQCPITTPEYSLSVTGSNKQLSFSIPVSYTFDSGFLTNLSITNGTLGTFTLSATTSAPSSSQAVITGNIATSTGTPIATFLIDTNGFGNLKMATGSVYQILDWHIIN